METAAPKAALRAPLPGAPIHASPRKRNCDPSRVRAPTSRTSKPSRTFAYAMNVFSIGAPTTLSADSLKRSGSGGALLRRHAPQYGEILSFHQGHPLGRTESVQPTGRVNRVGSLGPPGRTDSFSVGSTDTKTVGFRTLQNGPRATNTNQTIRRVRSLGQPVPDPIRAPIVPKLQGGARKKSQNGVARKKKPNFAVINETQLKWILGFFLRAGFWGFFHAPVFGGFFARRPVVAACRPPLPP